MAIGVGPIELPPYANRLQMVTDNTSYELHTNAFEQWAEPLRDSFLRVLAEILSLLLATDRVAVAWRENRDLHTRLTRLELENARLRSAAVENDRLRERLGLPRYQSLPLTPVEVLALTGEPVPAAATLSAGRNQGVEIGDAVVTSAGLVGRT